MSLNQQGQTPMAYFCVSEMEAKNWVGSILGCNKPRGVRPAEGSMHADAICCNEHIGMVSGGMWVGGDRSTKTEHYTPLPWGLGRGAFIIDENGLPKNII